MSGVLLDIGFDAAIVEWRGPAPFYFAPVPADQVDAVREAARRASYGWGCVPVDASVDGTGFGTSLFPKDGGYLVPVKAAVRRLANVAPGDRVHVRLSVTATA